MTDAEIRELTTPLHESLRAYVEAMLRAAPSETARKRITAMVVEARKYLREIAYLSGQVPRPADEPPIEFTGDGR